MSNQAPSAARVTGNVQWKVDQPEGAMLFLIAPTFTANPIPCVLDSATGDRLEEIVLRVFAVFPHPMPVKTSIELWTPDRVVIAQGWST